MFKLPRKFRTLGQAECPKASSQFVGGRMRSLTLFRCNFARSIGLRCSVKNRDSLMYIRQKTNPKLIKSGSKIGRRFSLVECHQSRLFSSSPAHLRFGLIASTDRTV